MSESIRRRPIAVVAAVAAGVLAVAVIAVGLSSGGTPAPSGGSLVAGVSPSPGTTAGPTGSGSSTSSSAPGEPSATPAATPEPTATPVPTPTPPLSPMTGLPVTAAVAARHPIAVMVDDLNAARPQSGFSAASVVWQAPAEGGIPRYMMIFQDQVPASIGPVRSARYYYIAWAAEWRAVYAHVGGSPQALATLKSQGNGKLVYNADEFRWGGTYFHRVQKLVNAAGKVVDPVRLAPHNVYTDGTLLWKLAKRIGAKNAPMKAVWQFAPDAPLEARPTGGAITVVYPWNTIKYSYDRATNTYLRGVSGYPKQIDGTTSQRVAPKNVVIMMMSFGPLNDGHPNKHRLEAKVVGSGKAWIATNGKTILGTWRKKSLTAPTLFYDKSGKLVTLTAGQTFVQVMKIGSPVTIKDGKVPAPAPTPTPAASPSPSPSPSPTPAAWVPGWSM